MGSLFIYSLFMKKELTSKTKLNRAAAKSKKLTPFIKSLSGIIKLSTDYNHQKEYVNFLADKYQ